MKKTFMIATGSIDGDGDKIMPGSLKMPKDKKVLILKGFDSTKKLGEVDSVVEKKGKYIATAHLKDRVENLYPAIGFDILKYHMDGDIRVIDEMKLYCVGLCVSPSVDKSIKTIGEQCKIP